LINYLTVVRVTQEFIIYKIIMIQKVLHVIKENNLLDKAIDFLEKKLK
jgi:hypothetical protein